jgi:hypothetical protein
MIICKWQSCTAKVEDAPMPRLEAEIAGWFFKKHHGWCGLHVPHWAPKYKSQRLHIQKRKEVRLAQGR